MSTPLDRYRSGGQKTVIAVTAATNKGAAILMGTVMAVYVGRIGSALAVGLITTTFFFGLMAFSPVWGAIADVTGRRRAVLVVTALLAAVSILPLTVYDGVWAALAFRTLFAVFAAGFLPVMLTIVNEQGGSSGRGRAVGFFSSAAAVGFMISQFASGALIEAFARPLVYLAVAATAAAVAVTCLFVEDPTRDGSQEVTMRRLGREVRTRLVPTTGTDHLRTNGLQWLYVASFLRNMTVLGFTTLLPVYLVTDVGVTPFVMGIVLGINPAVQIVGMVLSGRLADSIGRKRLIVGGFAASGGYPLVLSTATIPESTLARIAIAGTGMAVLGGAFSALQTGIIAFIGDVAPTERESELIGLRSTARGLGGVVAPPLFGAMVMLAGFETTFALASLLAFGAASLVGVRVEESFGAGHANPADD